MIQEPFNIICKKMFDTKIVGTEVSGVPPIWEMMEDLVRPFDGRPIRELRIILTGCRADELVG